MNWKRPPREVGGGLVCGGKFASPEQKKEGPRKTFVVRLGVFASSPVVREGRSPVRRGKGTSWTQGEGVFLPTKPERGPNL